MDKDIMETVLTEVLEEQKQGNLLAENNGRFLQEQVIVIKRLEEKTYQQNEELKTFVTAKMETFSSQIASHSRPVKREFRILLFPEQNTTAYYKIVFGRIIFWLVILCLAKYVYHLGDKWLTGYNDKTRYQQAWETLYQQQPKRNQKMMQNILTKQ